ncbi:MAG: PfkB family carbohydrate kinase, partial [Phycicoccus sp.]
LDRDLSGRADRLCPDAPVPVVDVDHEVAGPGGAGLTALLCRGHDVAVTLVAPMADDDDARLMQKVLCDNGVDVIALAQHGATRVKTRVRSGGQSLVRIDSGGPAVPRGALPAGAAEVIAEADVVLVSCYGAGTTGHDEVRSALAARARRRPVVWDPHPRGGEPVPGCTLVTPNLAEARSAAGDSASPDICARRLLEHWDAGAVAVTAGADGAWLATPSGESLHAPVSAADGDPCGAGDAFAAAAARALAAGETRGEAVVDAVAAAAAFVAAGGVAGYRSRGHRSPTPAQWPERGLRSGATGDAGGGAISSARAAAVELVDRVRSAGGTVVATGGCFDVLHAGHVSMLEAARGLGDGLVVLLNSDDSVRRLKGDGRPVNRAEDRAAVLLALAAVDAVLVFDEPEPTIALGELRPDLWVKGGDYEATALPEADVVRTHGGRVVILPYLGGRSTTAVLDAL